MSRYIDADALKKRYTEVDFRTGQTEGVIRWLVEANIDNAPHIDIVRCKECKHFEKNDSILRGEWWCDFWADTIEDDGYCSYGERSKQ